MTDTKDDPIDLPSSSTTTKSPAGPIIQQSQESEEYQRALQTVVGTALGVILLVGLLALFFLLYRLRQQRHRTRLVSGSQPHFPVVDVSADIDVGTKPVPMVLVLYAYDCAVHEAAVVALSGLLMELCSVTISLDIWEENIIEKGLDNWLEDRLQEADFIMVVGSLGARLRCSKKRVRFREEPGRSLPDYFAVAVDYVAEKLRIERNKGLGVGKFISVVMDYSHLSDIPPQLETAKTYVLMRDFNSLCSHLTTASPDLPRKMREERLGVGDGEAWQQTEAGMDLWAALGQARAYLKTHPNWLEERIQPLPPRSEKRRPQKRRKGERTIDDMPLLPMTVADVNVVPKTMMHHNVNTNGVVSQVNSLHYHEERAQHEREGTYLMCGRQSSLPTTLCVNHNLSASLSYVNVSRSVDSFPPAVIHACDIDFGAESPCLFCQQGEYSVRRGVKAVHCPVHPPQSTCEMSRDLEIDSDLDISASGRSNTSVTLGVERYSRSRSLPSVGHRDLLISSTPCLSSSHTAVEGFLSTADCAGLLSQSRTVLHAEVHKEWDGTAKPHKTENTNGVFSSRSIKQLARDSDNRDMKEVSVSHSPRNWDPGQIPEAPKVWDNMLRRAASPSPSVSSDSCSSSSQSGSDSLERDLRSITMPHMFDHSPSLCFGRGNILYYDALPRSFSSSALAPGGSPCLAPYSTGMQLTVDLTTVDPSNQQVFQ